MEKEEIRRIIEEQRNFIATRKTLNISYRLEVLRKLRSLIIEKEKEISEALWKDFHKPEFEVIATESRFVIKEINYLIRHLKNWSGKKYVSTPLIHFISRSYIQPQPYGQVLVLSPWNFPFQLAFMPLAGALAAGNCVVLKASAQVPETSLVMKNIIEQLPDGVVAMISGDHSVSDFLLEQKFDYIFFTGSPNVGKFVMKKAAEKLIPVSLELGGKNPCVVCADANLEYAARRIAWGKFINCGQTCVSPDYILIDKKIEDSFLCYLVQEIKSFYGGNPEESADFARVISRESTLRLAELMKCGSIVEGGVTNEETRYIAPTVIKDVKPGDPIMGEEIFGPVLPVISYTNFEEVFAIIEMHSKPLATYIFSVNNKLIDDFMIRTQSGCAAINDTVMQIASSSLPYGGIGPSGMGRYHGRKSFETFSNMRSVLRKSNLLDIWLRYPPYSKFKTKLVSWLMS
jgi:aldehyde dehydrogenase (NAD+)